jgi:hypothetical protein
MHSARLALQWISPSLLTATHKTKAAKDVSACIAYEVSDSPFGLIRRPVHLSDHLKTQ